ncbi:hypothetical protein DD577_29530 [Klebsiella pneumoniae]|nr:hypothetical protein DD577_29530 [Klebsiella pneumoniae]
MCGELLVLRPAELLPPFVCRAPQGRNRARATAAVQGAVYRVPFTRDGGGRLWLSQPRRMGSNG